MQPEERQLRFRVHTQGTVNAVLFWFELDLDREGRRQLSTSPYQAGPTAAGSTWQQVRQPGHDRSRRNLLSEAERPKARGHKL